MKKKKIEKIFNKNHKKINKLINEYPKKKIYYDFSDGIDLSDDEIRRMINELIDLLKERLKEEKEHGTFGYIGTGNTMIFGTSHINEDKNIEIYIWVTKNYKEADMVLKK